MLKSELEVSARLSEEVVPRRQLATVQAEVQFTLSFAQSVVFH
jgi:hypothetical protein